MNFYWLLELGISVIKKFGFLILAGAILIYGILIGRYEIFPYSALQSVKNWAEQSDGERADLPPTSDLIETALKKIYTTQIHFIEDIPNGGGKAVHDHDVFIVDRHGNIHYMDFLNFDEYEVDVPPVPMGIDSLREFFSLEEDSPVRRFRVMDAHIEKSNDVYTLYVSHQYFNGECFSSRLSRIHLIKETDMVSANSEWEKIYETSPCIFNLSEFENFDNWVYPGQMTGGRVTRYNSDYLLLSVGSYGQDGRPGRESFSMDPSVPYGKFILINEVSGNHSIYASGFRNSQGLHIDSKNNIWSTDHGRQGGDELNLVIEGQNYGWPKESLGIAYGNQPLYNSDNQGRHDVYTQPFFAWAKSPVGISDLIRVEGPKFGLWHGDLLVSSLNGRSIFRLRLSKDETRVLYNEEIPIGYRIRNINMMGDGSILLRTDNNLLIYLDDAGPVYEEFNPALFFENNPIAMNLSAETTYKEFDRPMEGYTIFEQSCASCHLLNDGDFTLAGPHLENLKNRSVGFVDDYSYSTALRESDKVWDRELLSRYLRNPDEVFPGTRMIYVPLSDHEVELIVDYLFDE